MFRAISRYGLATFALLALAASDAAAANKEHQQMLADIRMLQEQGQRLQLQLAALAETLKVVTTKLDEQTSANRKLFADEKLLIDAIASELRIVREKADDNNVRLGSLAQDLEAMRQALQQQGAQPSTLPAQPAGAPPATPPNPAAPPAGGETIGMTPTQLYQRAWGDYIASDWDLAISGFQQYLSAYPKGPNAPDAQYYIGESYFGAGKFDQAREAYMKVIANFPSSARVPEAYYKLGMTYERMNDRPHAREAYETLIKNYPPDNPSVIQAKNALNRLQGRAK